MQLTRRKIWIGAGAAGGVVFIGALAFGPIVRAKANAQAERRGVELEIGTVRPGFGRVWLKDVAVRIPEVPAVEVRLQAVEVGVGPTLSVKRVVAHGGSVSVRGEPAEVERQVRAWRAKRTDDGGRAASGGLAYRAEGIDLAWYEIGDDPAPQYVWGAHYERDADGGERLGADRVSAIWRGASVEIENATIGLRRVDGRRVIERIAAEAVAAAIDLDALPLAKKGAGAASVERDVVKPAAAKRPLGKTPGAAALTARFNSWLPIDEKRGSRLRDRFGDVARLVASSLPEDGELDLNGLKLRVQRGKQGLGIGPARLHVTRSAEQLSVRLHPGTDAKAESALELGLDVPLRAGAVKIAIDGGPVNLAALGVKNGDLGLKDVDKATLALSGKAQLSADGRSLAWDGRGKLSGATIQQKWLAAGPVSGITLGFRGKGELLLDGSRIDVQNGELESGNVRVELSGLLERSPEWTKATFRGGVPLAACQSMLDASPRGLLPLLEGMQLSGTFSLTGNLEFDTRDLDRMTATWNVANACRIMATPAEIAPARFFKPWVRKVKDANGRIVDQETGPGTPGWVPRYAISPHMETAVLICEDGRFFRHEGFDHEAIRNSIRENLKAGRFFRGASTISMQLAKNLYLSRQKTISRKLEEAVLTMLLEQELTKEQIIELYLNVIEFGPGIYGIGPAAQHYFNASASQLSLGQALYLGSILPSPSKHYFGAGGQVTPGWMSYLRKLMNIAVKIKRISEAELEDALREQVTFGVPYSPRTEDSGEIAVGSEPDEAQFGPITPGGVGP